MPKVYDTRKQRAKALLERIRQGPCVPHGVRPKSAEEVARAYRRWSEAWILNELADLVPELRKLCRECWKTPDLCQCRKGLQHPG